ncbi:peroxiredoxin-6-like [Branchiostoma floridae x Branchiostoma japonicum]|uniref:Peroxiredoxin-6 n=1 Tax=Branchiostoma floridae TaxID=7739 RepID=C3YTZ1_BRAFL|eukprot:XP_002600256.1 hypothetical protein BRAFLDRAFT_276423 [Branchiostoma floridae]
MPVMSLGDELPNFYLENNMESGNLHDFISGSWAVLFSYPRSFTPICTTELARAAQLAPEFAKRGVKMLALSCDNGDVNKDWIQDVKMNAGIEGEFPIRLVADQDRQIAKALGLIDQDQPNDVSMPITCRAIFVIGPDKRLRMSMVYPSSCGHNFEEILRSIDSLFMVESWVVGTPANWRPGDDVMVVPSIPKKEEATRFPKGVTRFSMPSGKDYMRLTSDDF